MMNTALILQLGHYQFHIWHSARRCALPRFSAYWTIDGLLYNRISCSYILVIMQHLGESLFQKWSMQDIFTVFGKIGSCFESKRPFLQGKINLLGHGIRSGRAEVANASIVAVSDVNQLEYKRNYDR